MKRLWASQGTIPVSDWTVWQKYTRFRTRHLPQVSLQRYRYITLRGLCLCEQNTLHFERSKKGQSVKQTTQLHVVSGVRMSGVILHTLTTIHAFMAGTETTSPSPLPLTVTLS
jgi:hypothetical protein